jgi:hypothetical protein
MLRTELSRVPSINHATFNAISREILDRKKKTRPQNLALQLYAQASIDLHNPEFFEAALIQFKQPGMEPNIKELGYLAQASAILRRSEYTALLIKWLDDCLEDRAQFSSKQEVWRTGNEFAFCQTLQAIA